MDFSRAGDAAAVSAAATDEPGLAFAEAVRQLVEHESWAALAAWVQADGDVAGLIGYGGPRAWRPASTIPLDTRRRRAFSRALTVLRTEGLRAEGVSPPATGRPPASPDRGKRTGRRTVSTAAVAAAGRTDQPTSGASPSALY